MSFGNIKDQDIPIRLLQNMIRRDRIPNGLLFWGVGGVGKHMTAIEMAKAVNCTGKDNLPCDKCLSCRKVVSGNHPDLTVVAPLKKSRIIGVETIESINELASLRPFESPWRVFIIQEAERMGLPAQNHLLKTLEEPPGKSIFMLISEYPGMLLPTIRSRCQRIRFSSLRPETIIELLLQKREVSRERAESIAALAQGQMSRACDLVDTGKREVVLDISSRLAKGEDPVEIASEFTSHLKDQKANIQAQVESSTESYDKKDISREDLEEQKNELSSQIEALARRNIMEYLYLFQTWYRDELVYQATGDIEQILNRDQMSRFETTTAKNIGKKISAIEKARVYLERFLNEERVIRDLFFALAE